MNELERASCHVSYQGSDTCQTPILEDHLISPPPHTPRPGYWFYIICRLQHSTRVSVSPRSDDTWEGVGLLLECTRRENDGFGIVFIYSKSVTCHHRNSTCWERIYYICLRMMRIVDTWWSASAPISNVKLVGVFEWNTYMNEILTYSLRLCTVTFLYL